MVTVHAFALALLLAAQPGLVKIVAYDENGRTLRSGAGFFLTKDGHVITSRDLLRGAVRAEVQADRVYPVRGVVLEAVSAGLVQIAVDVPPGTEIPAISFGADLPKIGEAVTLAAGGATAVVRAVRDVPAFGKVLRISGSIPVTATAMPVLNGAGEAIGVALWQAPGLPDTGFALAAESVPVEVPSQVKTLAEWNAAAGRDFVATAQADYREGLSQLFLDHFEDALAGFQQAIKKNPRFAEAWFHSGFAYAKMGRQTQKIEAYKQAIRIKPGFGAARYALGVSYALAGEGELAEAEHEALKKIDPALAERLGLLVGAIVHTDHEPGEDHPAPKKN